MTWNYDDPLARLPGERTRAGQALRDYAYMGAGRSLAKLHQRYQSDTDLIPVSPSPARGLATLKRWSTRYDWQARVARFDDLDADAALAEWSERRRQLREADWTLGDDLRRKVADFLERLPLFVCEDVAESSEVLPDGTRQVTRVVTVSLRASLVQIAQALLAASKLQCLAADEPTDNISLLSGSALDAVIERELRRLADWPDEGAPDASGKTRKN